MCELCYREEMGRWMSHVSVGLGLLLVLLTYCHAEGEEKSNLIYRSFAHMLFYE